MVGANVADTFADRSPRLLGGRAGAATADAAPSMPPALPPVPWRWRLGTGDQALRRACWALFLLLTLTQITMAFAVVSPLALAVLVAARRVTWLVVTVIAVFDVLSAKPSDQLKPLLAFVPFGLAGIGSALLGDAPVDGVSKVALWLMTVLSACVIGRKFRNIHLPAVLLVWFGAVLLASIVVALAFPRIGVIADGRVAHGAWRGVFVAKNWLAWYAGFAVLLAAFGGGLRIMFRVALTVLAGACLYFAHSAGSVMALGAVAGIMALIALWRRLGLSPGMRVLANASVLGVAAIAGSIGYRGILAALGRNVTLTGRTTIWQAYFSRALDTWVYGAGPGSFTELSSATQDVGLRFQTLGKIYTPHNFFIAVFGETGIIGLLAYVLAFATILFNEWQVPHAKSRDLLQAFTLFFLISGLDETHEVFGVGAGIFMIMLIRAWGWPDRPAPVVNAPGLHGAT